MAKFVNVKDLRQWLRFQRRNSKASIKCLRKSTVYASTEKEAHIQGWESRLALLEDFETAFIKAHK